VIDRAKALRAGMERVFGERVEVQPYQIHKRRNVKRWRAGDQPLRWTATGLLETEKKFRKVKVFRQLEVLYRRTKPSLTQQVRVA
jgi:hypothetical protein